MWLEIKKYANIKDDVYRKEQTLSIHMYPGFKIASFVPLTKSIKIKVWISKKKKAQGANIFKKIIFFLGMQITKVSRNYSDFFCIANREEVVIYLHKRQRTKKWKENLTWPSEHSVTIWNMLYSRQWVREKVEKQMVATRINLTHMNY